MVSAAYRKVSHTSGKVFRVVLAIVLAISLTPFLPAAAHATEESQENAQIEEMLSCCDYAEGEVLALVRQDASLAADLSSDDASLANSLIDSGEGLMETSMEAALVGMGEAAGAPSEGDGDALLNGQDDAAVEVVLITSETLSTRELLYALSESDRVLAVQPNYIHMMDDGASPVDEEQAAALADVLQAQEETVASSEVADDADAQLATDDPTDPHYPDLTSTQWAYNPSDDFGALKRENAERKASFGMGIPNWNDPTAEKNSTGYIAVMDTGVDYTNPDLQTAMAHLTAEQSAGTNGGEYGYNALENTSDPMDVHGHGTHCAGIIAADWNGIGTSGVCNGAKIIAVRAGKEGGSVPDSAILKGYAYLSVLIDNGVNVIAVNNSWGSDCIPGCVTGAAMYALGDKGAISVLAAGNSTLNNDRIPATSIAMTNNPYVIVVNSCQQNAAISSFSNYGQNVCDVFGPGSEIMSTWTTGQNSKYQGLADPSPLYLNTFGNEDEFDQLLIQEDSMSSSTSNKLLNGVMQKSDLPSTGSEITGSEYFTYDANSTFDAGSGSAKWQFSSDGTMVDKASMNLFIPVHKDDVSKIENLGISLYFNREPSFVALLLCWQKDGDEGGRLYSGLNTSTFLAKATVKTPGEWASGSVSTASQRPASTEGETYSLYTIPSGVDDDIVLLPVLMSSLPLGGDIVSDVFLDAISIGSGAPGSAASAWALIQGTSMATPAIAGATGVAAKVLAESNEELSGSEQALWLAHYLKSHILEMDGYQDKCRQGGLVNLSIPDEQTTPVIDRALQDGISTTVRISGAYFGNEPGRVSVSGAWCNVESWSDTQIVATIPSGVGSSEAMVRVHASNGRTGAATIRYQGSNVKSFPNVLPSPSTQLIQGPFTTSAIASSVGMVSGTMTAVDDKIYAFLFGNDDENPGIICFDTASNSWSVTCELDKGMLPDALYYSSIAEKDEVLYLFITCNNPTKKLWEKRLFTYDLASARLASVDISAFDAGFYGASLINAEGELLLVGGMKKNAETETLEEMTQDNVAKLQVADGTASVEAKGDFFTLSKSGKKGGVILPRLAFFDGSLYAACGSHQDRFMGAVTTSMNTSLTKISLGTDGRWISTDMTSTLPAGLDTNISNSQPSYGLTATNEGLFIVGATVCDANGVRSVNDTYVLYPNATSFQPWSRSFSLGVVTNTLAVSIDGAIYALGESAYEELEAGCLYFACSDGPGPLDPYSIEDAEVSVAKATYTGEGLTPELTVTLKGKTLQPGKDFEASYINARNAGEAVVVLTGCGNYIGSKAVTFQISKAKSSISLKGRTATYNGKAVAVAAAKVSGTSGKITYAYYTDADCTVKTGKTNAGVESRGAAPVKAGTYYCKASAAADANYKAAKSVAVKIVINRAPQSKMKDQEVKRTVRGCTNGKLAVTATFNVTKAGVQGRAKTSFALTSVSKLAKKHITVSDSGKVTVKKGLAKGTYTLKVKETAKACRNYTAKTVTKTYIITVK